MSWRHVWQHHWLLWEGTVVREASRSCCVLFSHVILKNLIRLDAPWSIHVNIQITVTHPLTQEPMNMCNYSGLNWDPPSRHCPQGETPSEVATKIPAVVPLLLFLGLLHGNISILCFWWSLAEISGEVKDAVRYYRSEASLHSKGSCSIRKTRVDKKVPTPVTYCFQCLAFLVCSWYSNYQPCWITSI